MTINEYMEKLRTLASSASGEIVIRSIIPAANQLSADIQNRIGRNGEDSAGKKLSAYSTKPAYFSRDKFVRKSSFTGLGKRGKKGKSQYFKDGYAGLRKAQGRDTNVKNLTYTGDMFKAFVVGKNDKEVLIGFNDMEASKKRKWNEKREGATIFKASNDEIKQYNENFIKEYKYNIAKLSS